MSAGKLAVQVAHASVSCILKIIKSNNREWEKWLEAWESEGQKKVVLKVMSDKELESIYKKAIAFNLPCSFINDAGLTQLEPGTSTAVGIGPAPDDLVDKIVGHLKLY